MEKYSRRQFLKIGGNSVAGVALAGSVLPLLIPKWK